MGAAGAARDRVGNEDLWTVHVVLDLVPPTLVLDPVEDVPSIHRPFTIGGTTSDDVVNVTANGVEGEVEDGVLSVTFDLDEGTTSIVVEVRDAAGNVASTTISPIVVDTEPPTFKLDYPGTTDRERVTIKGTCSEDVVEVWVDLQQATVEDGRFSIKVDLPREGKHRFNLTFVDQAGNTAAKTITIDRGEEVPGAGTGLALLGLALVAVVARRGRGPLSGTI